MVFLLLASSCGNKEAAAIPDPAGTNTYIFKAAEKEYTLDLYKNKDETPGNPPYAWIRIGLSSTSLNFGFIAVTYSDSDFNYGIISYFETGGEIVNLGKVNGLGSITLKPTTGWVKATAAEVGNGYVVRFKHTTKYDNVSLPYYYARFYVTEFLTSTTGGIGFVKAKYQIPF